MIEIPIKLPWPDLETLPVVEVFEEDEATVAVATVRGDASCPDFMGDFQYWCTLGVDVRLFVKWFGGHLLLVSPEMYELFCFKADELPTPCVLVGKTSKGDAVFRRTQKEKLQP